MTLTEKQKQSRYKYAKENLKRIPLDVQKEKFEIIKAAADSVGETVNGFIKAAIDARLALLIEQGVLSSPADPSEGEDVQE